MSAGSLAGRVALVAGVEGGAERAIAERLAADGARVAASDRDGGAAADPRAAEEIVAAAEREHGPIEILVPVAADASAHTFAGRDRARWWREVDASLSATFRLVRAVVPGMKRAGSGRIVIVTSAVGLRPRLGATAHAAAAAGSIAFGKTLARELAPAGILVNVVARAATDGADDAVAATVAFLASDRAGAFVGQVLDPGGAAS